MDRQGNEGRKRTVLGDQRQRAVSCEGCLCPTYNIGRKCDDCMDGQEARK